METTGLIWRLIGPIFLIGVLSGCTTTAGSDASTQPPPTTHTPRSGGAPRASPSPPILVWTPGQLSRAFIKRVNRLPGVRRTLTVEAGTVWLTQSQPPSGATVDRAPPGMGIPLDLAGASVSQLRWFLPSREWRWLPALREGRALLGATSARLRRLGAGGTLALGPRRVLVAGVVPDADIGAHEVFVSAREAALLGVRARSYLLVDPTPGSSGRALATRIRRAAPEGVPVRVRGPGRAAYLRQADAVLPPVIMKSVFGEFAATPTARAGGWITIDPRWVARNIVTARVPILGQVTCNRVLIPLLRGALRDLVRRGLASLIHTDQFAGCYAPRVIPGSPTGSISHHAWGAAVDLNSLRNPFGATPHQDPRLVAVFRRWGFIWGGAWLVPDGMHFEFHCFPAPGAGERRPACSAPA